VRFIEWQALVLSPICPHVADFIWTEWLGNKTSILKAKWPVTGSVDESGKLTLFANKNSATDLRELIPPMLTFQ